MTVVEVDALAVPDALVAIEARAALPVDGMNESAREMWIEYLLGDPGLIAEGACTGLSAWSFGSGKEMADELADLVVARTKRATASSLAGGRGRWKSRVLVGWTPALLCGRTPASGPAVFRRDPRGIRGV
jgi:hypothetical protein